MTDLLRAFPYWQRSIFYVPSHIGREVSFMCLSVLADKYLLCAFPYWQRSIFYVPSYTGREVFFMCLPILAEKYLLCAFPYWQRSIFYVPSHINKEVSFMCLPILAGKHCSFSTMFGVNLSPLDVKNILILYFCFLTDLCAKHLTH